MKKLIALFCLASTFSTIVNAATVAADGTLTYKNDQGTRLCTVNISDNMVSVKDVSYSDSTRSEVESYDTDAFFISREEIIKSIPETGSGEIVRTSPASEGYDALKLTLTFKNHELVSGKIKRASGFFGETTSCSLK